MCQEAAVQISVGADYINKSYGPEPGINTAAGLLRAGPELNLHVRTLVDRNAAVAEVTYVVSTHEGGDIYVETGSSKRDKGDQFSPELGEQLAVARALFKLAAKIKADAERRAPWA